MSFLVFFSLTCLLSLNAISSSCCFISESYETRECSEKAETEEHEKHEKEILLTSTEDVSQLDSKYIQNYFREHKIRFLDVYFDIVMPPPDLA